LVRFLFVDESVFAPEKDAAATTLGPDAEPVLRSAIGVLRTVRQWQAAEIEQVLQDSLVDGLGLEAT
jgi:glutamyl-tRNA synthetase